MYILDPPPVVIILVKYPDELPSHDGNIIIITSLEIKQDAQHGLPFTNPQSFPRVQATGFPNRASHLIGPSEIYFVIELRLLVDTRVAFCWYYDIHWFCIIFFQFHFGEFRSTSKQDPQDDDFVLDGVENGQFNFCL